MNTVYFLLAHGARAFALFGGGVLLGMVGLATISVVGDIFWARPLSWLVEIVELGSAIAMFAFLPYATWQRAHIVVEAIPYPRRMRAWLDAIALAGFAVLVAVLLWRMGVGYWRQFVAEWQETTFILAIPLWVAAPPILLSLGMWVVVCLALCWDTGVRALGTKAGHQKREC